MSSMCFPLQLPRDEGERIDCKYYNPEVVTRINDFKKNKIQGRKLIELNLIADVKGGKRLPKGTVILGTERDTIPYVRGIDVKRGTVNLENCQKISLEIHNKIKKYQLNKGDIVITIVGTIGECGILREDVELCNFTENVAKIAINDNLVINEFLNFFLNSEFGKMQSDRFSVGSLQYKLSLKNCRRINILVPYDESKKSIDIEEQKRILKKIKDYEDSANKTYQEYKLKIKQLNDFFIDYFKVEIPREQKNQEVYAKNISEDLGDRFDALFMNPFLNKLRNKLKKVPHKKLGNLIEIQKSGKTIPSEFYKLIELEDINENIGEVSNIKDVSELGSDKILFREGELLISKLQPEKGKIVLVDEKLDGCVGSSELIPVKIVSEDVLPEYLWAILRSSYTLKQWQYEITGCSRERIGKKELDDTIVPLPSIPEQKKVIDKVKLITKDIKDTYEKYLDYYKKMEEMFLLELTKKERR